MCILYIKYIFNMNNILNNEQHYMPDNKKKFGFL